MNASIVSRVLNCNLIECDSNNYICNRSNYVFELHFWILFIQLNKNNNKLYLLLFFVG
jgi:hypothetical protein